MEFDEQKQERDQYHVPTLELEGRLFDHYVLCHKTNQAGRNIHPRHVYANPVKPFICPVLALGVYLLTNSFSASERSLFPGKNQYQRFSKKLQKLIDQVSDGNSLAGETFRIYGTQSFRKGAATYACSGSTAAPHISAVSNRAGWKQPGAQDTYLVYADAGDQYVGRVVSGLPQYSHDFALLPPFFKDTSDPLIVEALDVCFPSHRGRIEDNVLVFCLASIVYHQHWLREHIGAAHPVFRTPLFLHESLLVQLGAKVKCRLPKAKDAFCSTGIPPHIDHLSKLKVLEAGLAKGFSMVEKKCDDVVGDIMRGLDERQVESHLTPTGLRNQLSALIEELGLNRIRDFLSDATRAGATGASGSGAVESSRQLGSFPLFVWDDGTQNRLLPQDFRFPPNGSVRDSWLLYLVGVPTKGIRPLKDIGRDHFNVPDARKRASEFFQLMELFEAHVKGAAAWENDFSVEAAIRMFEAGKGCLSATSNTANKYSRRADQLGWRRAHSLLVGKSAKVPLTIRKDRQAQNSCFFQ